MSDVRLTLDRDENDRLLIVDAVTFDTIAILADTALAPARARLMASAPDLLDALETLLGVGGHYDACFGGAPYYRRCEPICAKARAAVQAARGLEGS